jgi:colicin import membrane protein
MRVESFEAGPMPRKLKTFVTESGFFELAVAAPSMKAALRDWDIDVNLFQQGLARQTDDPAIVAAAEQAPGKVLRRPIGSKAPFGEAADLPMVKGAPAKRRPRPERPSKSKTPAEKFKTKSVPAPRHHAVDLHAIRAARTALHEAEEQYRSKIASLDKKRASLDRSAEKLEREWQRQKQKLEKEIEGLKS